MKNEGQNKILLVVMDGISGRPTPSLDGKTSLESADTPNLDSAAEKGVSGIMDPISPGIRPGSDTSHLSLVGYDPYEYYTGRGPFEAAGAGIDVEEGDIAFRCNFATEEDGVIIDRRAGRINNTKPLADSIKKEINKINGVEVIFKESTGHRAALVLRGESLSSSINGSDPKKPGKPPKEINPIDPEAQETSKIINEFVDKAEKILENHPINKERKDNGLPPANTLLLRGAGEVPAIEPIDKKIGLDSAIVSGTGLMKGIGQVVGMEVVDLDGATGSTDSDIKKKARKTINLLDSKDFVLLHIKGGDEAGHDGDAEAKKKFIEEKIDPAVGILLENLDLTNTLIALTADHSTPITVKDHTGDPVPITMVGEGVRVDDVDAFDENTYKGGLVRIQGKDLMPICLDITDRSNKYGA